MSSFLPVHEGQHCYNFAENPFDIDINHAILVGYLEPTQRRMQHQPRVIDHHINAPIPLNNGLN